MKSRSPPEAVRERERLINSKMALKVDKAFDIRRKFEAQAELKTWVIL